MIQLTSHGRRGGLGVRFLHERCLLHPESRMLDSKPSMTDFFVKTFFSDRELVWFLNSPLNLVYPRPGAPAPMAGHGPWVFLWVFGLG